VVVILYRPSDESLLWQVVSGKTVESTGSGWKVVVPHSQRLSRLSREDLLSVARREHEEEVDLGRIRTEVQQPLVVIARSGSRVVVEAVEWVNKTSGRTDLRLLRVDPDGAEATLDWWTNLLGSASVPEAVQRLFPWSEPRIDESYYESCDAARFDEEEGIWDSEEQRQVHFESFSEWARRHLPDGLRPYSEDGEVARWRIVLHVNPISLAHDLASTLPIDHPDRLEWFAALKEAEMNHQAESALYGLAQRLVGRYLGS
jgi:hypothetical protein